MGEIIAELLQYVAIFYLCKAVNANTEAIRNNLESIRQMRK